MQEFQLSIIAAERVFYEGPCVSLVVPTEDGERGILANHSNLIEAIVPGELRFTAPGEKVRIAFVSDGMLKVEDNEVMILVDFAERPDEIDENRAKREEAAAKEAMLQQRSRRDFLESQATVARAMNRLKVKHKYEDKGM